MTRLTLALVAAAAVSGCSNGRTRSTSAADDQANTARELRVAPPDTTAVADSVNLSSRDSQPVSPVEQHAPAPKKLATSARKPARHRRTPAPAPAAAVDSTTAQGYAPSGPADTGIARASGDSSRPADSLADSGTVASPSDTGSRPSDTAAASSADTNSAAPPAAAGDTTSHDTSLAASDSAAPDSAAPDSAALGAAPPESAPRSAVEPAGDAGRRTLPIGTEIHAALDDSISSRRDSAGRSVTAQVSENVTGSSGRILIPAGSAVRLTVTRLGSSKSKGSQGQLALRVDGILLGNQLRKVEANVQPVSRELRGRGVTGADAAKVGVGAAGGAVLGRVIGGNTKGAVVGGVVGAAGGAVVASQTATRDVVVKAKTPVVLVLTAPLVTP